MSIEFYIIYETKNLVNNKIYIGYHKTLTPYIFDGYFGSGLALKRAIEKYGVENFKQTTLHVFETLSETLLKEKEIVNKKFINQSNTYNMRVGGKGGSIKPSEKTKQKISNTIKQNGSSKGKNNPMYGKFGKDHPVYGTGVLIQQYDLNKNLISEGLMSDYTKQGFSQSMLSHCCSMRHKSHKGFVWKYKNDDTFQFPNMKTKGKWKSKSTGSGNDKVIQQYDLDKNLITENTAYLFSESSTKLSAGQIIRCCKGKIKTHNGFFWKFKDDDTYKFPEKGTFRIRSL